MLTASSNAVTEVVLVISPPVLRLRASNQGIATLQFLWTNLDKMWTFPYDAIFKSEK